MRTRLQAVVGSTVFFLLAPGVVVGVVPWWLTGWHMRYASAYAIPLQIIGTLLIVTGVGVLAHAYLRFALEGIGTPAPVAPPRRLVLAAYAALIWLVTAAFVRWYEEPTLRRVFGADYETYHRTVPAWWPHRR